MTDENPSGSTGASIAGVGTLERSDDGPEGVRRIAPNNPSRRQFRLLDAAQSSGLSAARLYQVGVNSINQVARGQGDTFERGRQAAELQGGQGIVAADDLQAIVCQFLKASQLRQAGDSKSGYGGFF